MGHGYTYHITNDDTHDILTNHLEMHFIELKKIHIQKLLEEGRKEAFDRVLRDNEYQEKLLREYHLK